MDREARTASVPSLAGRIIGVGNGNPTSLEKERFFPGIRRIQIGELQEQTIPTLALDVSSASRDYGDWIPAISQEPEDWTEYRDSFMLVRGSFSLPALTDGVLVTLFSKSIVSDMTIYINGYKVAGRIQRGAPGQAYVLPHDILREGHNTYLVKGKRFRKSRRWEELNRDPGLVQVVFPADPWRRQLFNGLAQVLIQSSNQQGEITLGVRGKDVGAAALTIRTTTE